MTPAPVAESLLCPQCGYDLRAIESERCPECGSRIDRNTMAQSQIPWTHRRQIGWWRAYRRTVAMVLLHPKKLAAEIARPVSYRDAQVFRWVTILITAAIFGLILAAWWPAADSWDRRELLEQVFVPMERFPEPLPDVLRLAFVATAGIVILVMLTGIPSYFFHPRQLSTESQNRALAISYYPSGVLMPCGWSLACAWAIALFRTEVSEDFSIRYAPLLSSAMGTALFLSAGFLAWYTASLVLVLRRITHCGFVRAGSMVVITSAASLAAGALVILTPTSARYMKLMINWR